MISARVVLIALAAYVFYQWMNVKPRVNWVKSEQVKFDECPKVRTEVVMFFGATSMLGRHVVDSFLENDKVCLISFGRSTCSKCHINIKGDLRDTRLVKRALAAYDIKTVMTSIRPPLLGVHYKDYIEINLMSMIELVRAAKAAKVQQFLYVSSIACASHYIPHVNASEDEKQPYLTDYEAPYDVSKRLSEDIILAEHEEGVFHTISIRTGGIYGGSGDPYEHYQYLPFVPTFDVPAVIDANYASNIGDALLHVNEVLAENPSVGGQFYYYTGEPDHENITAVYVSKASKRPLIRFPYSLLTTIIDVWSWFRLDHNVYSWLDLFRMAIIPQNFNQSKFFSTFRNFKPKHTMEEAFQIIYGLDKDEMQKNCRRTIVS